MRSDLLPHNIQVHDVQFQILSIDCAPPPPDLAGRKDTVYLEPRREYCLLMRFDDYTEDRMPYMYHCHLLLHEDEGLMGRFLVVDGDADRNDRDRTPPGPYHSQSHDE